MQVNNRCIKLKLNEGDYSLVTMSLPWPSFIAVLNINSTSSGTRSRVIFQRYILALNGKIQISANNSTTLRYSKKTRYSAINRGQILGQFEGYNSTRVIFESEL